MNGFKHLFSWRSFDIKKIASAYTFYRTPYISAALGYKPHYEGYENVTVMITINTMVWDRRTFLVSSIEGECNQPWPMDRYLMRFMGSSCNFSPQGMKNAESPPMHFLLDKPASWFLKTNKITVDEIKGINSEFDFHLYCIYMYFYKIHMPSRGVVHLQRMISIIEYFELVSILNQDDFRRLHIVMRSGAIFVDESRISERSSQHVTPVRPILPPDGMCNLCFDGAWLVCGDIVCSGGGYVLYNHDGVVLLHRYFPLKSVVDAFDAEVQSLHLGLLDVVMYTDFLDVVIEGDCRDLIEGARCAKYVEAAHAGPFWADDMNGFKHLFSWRFFDIKKIASAYTFYRTPYISAALGYKPHYEGYENVTVMITINTMVWDRRTFLVSSIEGECNQPWPMDRYLMRFMGSSCNFSPQGMKNAESPPMHFLLDKPASWFLKTNKITVDEIKGINSEFDFHLYCIYMYFYKIHMPSRGVVHLQRMISIIEYFELVSILNQDDFRRLHIVMRSGAIFVDESRISERSSQHVTPVRPILPPDGMCNLCFDGAWLVCGDIVCSGGGYVLYNHDGVVLLHRYFPLKSVVDAFDAEVQSLHLGLLDVLMYTDFLDVVIEGDCRDLIDGARCAKYVEAAHAGPFWKLQSLLPLFKLPLFKQLRIQFIYREGNRAADCCAQIGLFINQNQQVRSARADFFTNYSRLLEKMNKYITEDSKQLLQFRVHPDWNSKKMKGDSNQG